MAGIEKKVDSGLEKVVGEIKMAHRKMDGPIDQIILDVFGFSRAAAARYFIHRALFDYDGAKYRAYQAALKRGEDQALRMSKDPSPSSPPCSYG